MPNPPIGFRILPCPSRPALQHLEQLAALPTPNISDNMQRHCGAAAGLRPYHRGGKLIGPAFTVKTRPGDNLLVHKAIDMAGPGDVIVVDAGGEVAQAIIGEIMTAHAAKRGIAGFVIDGAIRDAEAIASANFPVFALAIAESAPCFAQPARRFMLFLHSSNSIRYTHTFPLSPIMTQCNISDGGQSEHT